MSTEPYLKFYLGDYIKDTRILPLNVRGAWADLILFMWDNNPKGEISGTIEDFSRLMCCSIEEANLVIQTLKQRKIFDYHELDDRVIRIVSRKQKKMVKLSEIRSESGKNGGNPKLVKPKENILLKHPDNLNPEYEYESNKTLAELGSVEGKGGWTQMPGEKEMGLELPEIKAGAVLELLVMTGNKQATMGDVQKLWGIFKIQNFTGSKYYKSENDAFSHFINCSKTAKINGTTSGQNRRTGKSTGAYQILDDLNEQLGQG